MWAAPSLRYRKTDRKHSNPAHDSSDQTKVFLFIDCFLGIFALFAARVTSTYKWIMFLKRLTHIFNHNNISHKYQCSYIQLI